MGIEQLVENSKKSLQNFTQKGIYNVKISSPIKRQDEVIGEHNNTTSINFNISYTLSFEDSIQEDIGQDRKHSLPNSPNQGRDGRKLLKKQ